MEVIFRSHKIPQERGKEESPHYLTVSRRLSGDSSANDTEAFATPPTSPSHRKPSDQRDGTADALTFSKPSLLFHNGRKRENGEPSTAQKSTKLPRHHSEHEDASITSHPDSSVTQTEDSYDEEKPTVSFLPSYLSSTTAASSTWTSQNSSFRAISRVTSFESFPGQIESVDRPQQIAKPFQVSSGDQIIGSESGSDVMDFDLGAMKPSNDIPAPVATTTILRQPAETDQGFSARLQSKTPFTSSALVQDATVPFRQVYEVVRVATESKIEISAFSGYLKKTEDDYSVLWMSLCKVLKARGISPPERSSHIAWEKAQKDFQGASLTAKLSFHETAQDGYLNLQLLPIKLEPTYRLSRHFGADRFLVVAIPGLGPEDLPLYLKVHSERFRDAFVEWVVKSRHRLLGRHWRAFFVKPESTKKTRNGNRSNKDTKFRLYLFAEDGPRFWHTRPSQVSGETDYRTSWVLDRPYVSVQKMIEWFMPFQPNRNQQILKFFARLSLGLSTTVKTVQFRPTQMIRSDDAYADSPCERRLDVRRSDSKKTGRSPSKNKSAIMNDGCARISRRAANYIATQLNLDSIPSVFQARIGGAKGVWMIDALDEFPNRQDNDGPLWIEITDSQLKFEAPAIDSIQPNPDRTTFEVIAWSKPLSSSYLNYQLLPILQNRGVPRKVFQQLLREDLYTKTSELEAAMEDGLTLRKWCQANYPTTADRLKSGGIEMLGGFPDSGPEKINWLIDHGFEPKTCKFLRDLLFQTINDYCLRIENRMNIGLELSTSAFMIADPLNVLKTEEVHIGFSGTFKDTQGFNLSMLHNVDVLVARLPAHSPSDVQKRRAVYKPELRIYQDVIVFSSRGNVSLASRLSGGDYDGDKAWICWEPSIVNHFENAPIPKSLSPESYGIEKDNSEVSEILQHPDYIDRFLCHAFDFNLQPSLLGSITLYHEAMCYAKDNIDSPQALSLAGLLGLLVDSRKAGFHFPDSKWADYRKELKLPKHFPKPAYRDKGTSKPKDNLIDNLVFKDAKSVREDALATFDRKFQDVPYRDEDLIRLYKKEMDAAKSDPSIAEVLTGLKNALNRIMDNWIAHCSRRDDDDDFSRDAQSKTATGPSFRTVVMDCREDFLKIPPSAAEPSPIVQRWIEEHHAGTSNYWDLLKASTASYMYPKSKGVWYAAGVELGELKATAYGRGTYRTVVSGIYETLKLDRKLADVMTGQNDEQSQMMAGDVDGFDAFGDGDAFD